MFSSFLLTSYAQLIIFFFFFFNDTATTEIYTLSLHDALPILTLNLRSLDEPGSKLEQASIIWLVTIGISGDRKSTRLNSSHSQISYAVFCLKKKKTKIYTVYNSQATRSVHWSVLSLM